MVERGKTLFPQRTRREITAEHNGQTKDEKTLRLLARCGFAKAEIPDLFQSMKEHGSAYVDEEISAHFGDPVGQVRVLLGRRAVGYWKTGQAQTLLAEYDRGAMSPEEWERLYVDVYEDKLYLDRAA